MNICNSSYKEVMYLSFHVTIFILEFMLRNTTGFNFLTVIREQIKFDGELAAKSLDVYDKKIYD